MIIEEIKRNKPDGATGYSIVDDVVFYYKTVECFRKRFKQYFFMDGIWIPCHSANPKPL